MIINYFYYNTMKYLAGLSIREAPRRMLTWNGGPAENESARTILSMIPSTWKSSSM